MRGAGGRSEPFDGAVSPAGANGRGVTREGVASAGDASSTLRLPPAPRVVGSRRLEGERQTRSSALSFAGVADAETSKNQGKIAAPRDGGQQLPGSTGDAAE